jgi:hypothetical protein
MLPQLGLLPPLGHKKAIGNLGYPIAWKLGVGLVTFVHFGSDKETNTGLYNTDTVGTNEVVLRGGHPLLTIE